MSCEKSRVLGERRAFVGGAKGSVSRRACFRPNPFSSLLSCSSALVHGVGGASGGLALRGTLELELEALAHSTTARPAAQLLTMAVHKGHTDLLKQFGEQGQGGTILECLPSTGSSLAPHSDALPCPPNAGLHRNPFTDRRGGRAARSSGEEEGRARCSARRWLRWPSQHQPRAGGTLLLPAPRFLQDGGEDGPGRPLAVRALRPAGLHAVG